MYHNAASHNTENSLPVCVVSQIWTYFQIASIPDIFEPESHDSVTNAHKTLLPDKCSQYVVSRHRQMLTIRGYQTHDHNTWLPDRQKLTRRGYQTHALKTWLPDKWSQDVVTRQMLTRRGYQTNTHKTGYETNYHKTWLPDKC